MGQFFVQRSSALQFEPEKPQSQKAGSVLIYLDIMRNLCYKLNYHEALTCEAAVGTTAPRGRQSVARGLWEKKKIAGEAVR